MSTANSRLMGRRSSSGSNRAVAAGMAGYQVGQLEIFSLAKPVVSGITTISGSWACKIQGTAASPLLLRMIEIYSTGGVNDVSLAIMTVNDGSPNASNAFLAWNTDVPMGGKWSWTGEVPLIDRYIYAKRNAAGATLQMFWQVEELNP